MTVIVGVFSSRMLDGGLKQLFRDQWEPQRWRPAIKTLTKDEWYGHLKEDEDNPKRTTNYVSNGKHKIRPKVDEDLCQAWLCGYIGYKP